MDKKGIWGLLPIVLLLVVAGSFYYIRRVGNPGEPSTANPLWANVTVRPIAPTPQLLQRGEILYKKYCATCHGIRGKGDGSTGSLLKSQPRDFTSFQFQLRSVQGGFPSNEDLFRTITVGLRAFQMPAFGHLSEEDRWALVYRLKRIIQEEWLELERARIKREKDPDAVAARLKAFLEPGPSANATLTPPLPTSALLDTGRKRYLQQCSICHGPKGRGDGPAADALLDFSGHPTPPRDFADSLVFRKAGWRLQDTFRVIRTGLPGTAMPASKLPESEIWALTHYVHQLRKDALGLKR